MALKAAFFDAVRSTLSDGKLSQHQVDVFNAISAAWDKFGDDLGYSDLRLAYVLATAWHEPGQAMVPNTESLNYSVDALLENFGRNRISVADARRLGRASGRPADQEAIANLVYGGDWGRENLGNTQPGDGWRFRGRGLVHLTGRRNYELWSKRLGVDLLANPDRAADLDIAVRILVEGAVKGTFTGKTLQDYINSDQCDFVGARRVVNGQDKATLIAGYAEKFAAALAGGRSPGGGTSKPPAAARPPKPVQTHWLAALLAALLAIFKR